MTFDVGGRKNTTGTVTSLCGNIYQRLYCKTSLAIKMSRADFIYISGNTIIGRLVSFSVVITLIANNTITIYFNMRGKFINTLRNITERLSLINKEILETRINKRERERERNLS